MGILDNELTIGELRKRLNGLPREFDAIKIASVNKDSNQFTTRDVRFVLGKKRGRDIFDVLKPSKDIHKEFWACICSIEITGVEVPDKIKNKNYE